MNGKNQNCKQRRIYGNSRNVHNLIISKQKIIIQKKNGAPPSLRLYFHNLIYFDNVVVIADKIGKLETVLIRARF